MLGQESHEATGGEVGDEEFLGGSGGGGERFGCGVAATNGAFHGGGPSGGGPVSTEEDAGPSAGGVGTVSVGAGSGRECRVNLFNHCGFEDAGFVDERKEFSEFTEGEVNDLASSLFNESL